MAAAHELGGCADGKPAPYPSTMTTPPWENSLSIWFFLKKWVDAGVNYELVSISDDGLRILLMSHI